MSRFDLSKSIGFDYPTIPVSWNKRDLLLYAVGIGAKKDDYQFVYDLDNSFSAFPTYPVVLSFKGDSQDVVDFRKFFGGGVAPPGLPQFDPNRVVHGSQAIEVIKQLPVEAAASAGWKLKKRIVGVHENKSGIIIDQEILLVDPKDVPYTRMITSSFNVGAKATGQKFSKAIATPPRPSKPVPKASEKKPDWVVKETTSEEQAILYRLSGDYNALHVDPKIGQAAGFGGVILHGLASFGFGARHVLSAVGGNSPTALKSFGVRFTSPVKPGDTIETSIWELGPGPDGTVEVGFEQKNLNSGKVCLGGGVAYVKKAATKSKL